MDLERNVEKYQTKLLVITGDFFLSDLQITKQDKRLVISSNDWSN